VGSSLRADAIGNALNKRCSESGRLGHKRAGRQISGRLSGINTLRDMSGGVLQMSLDKSLKVKTSLTGSRSVLSRNERIAKKIAEKQFDPKKDPALGLAKTRVK